jgi:DNA primase catalytic core
MYEDEPTLDEMKRAVHIFPLAAILGLNPKKIGSGEYVIKCPNPNHEDKTPSCHINHHKNVFHCKGCGAKGTIIDWLMLTEQIDQVTAIKRLKEKYHRTNSGAGQDAKVEFAKRQIEVEEKQPEPVNILESRIQNALSLTVDYCHNNFKAKKEGAGFMLKRGLIYGELVEDFKIGLSDSSLVHAVNDPEVLKSLVELGILKAGDTSGAAPTNGSLKEHFAGRVIFPVFDENGLIVQIYGRNIFGSGVKHMLLSGVPLALFNPRALIASEIILCESVIDALSIMAMGYRNVVASLSVNGMKDDIFEKIINSNVKKIFIAFDNDVPGNNAASLLAEKLIDHKIESFRIVFDEGSDANDLLRKSSSPSTVMGVTSNKKIFL